MNTFLKDFLKEFHDHRRNFASIIGGMELGGGGGISTMGVTNFNLQRN